MHHFHLVSKSSLQIPPNHIPVTCNILLLLHSLSLLELFTCFKSAPSLIFVSFVVSGGRIMSLFLIYSPSALYVKIPHCVCLFCNHASLSLLKDFLWFCF